MKLKAWLCAVILCCLFFCSPALAQYSNAAAEANNIFLQINQASSNAQRDVAQLRIDKWKIDGDDNRNASVAVSYRRKGEQAWKEGLPLLRIGNEFCVDIWL